jgi:hypothetical protein
MYSLLVCLFICPVCRVSNANYFVHRGVHLTDLTFIEDGNMDLTGGLINFSKRKLVYTVISQVKQYQYPAYNLQPVYQVILFSFLYHSERCCWHFSNNDVMNEMCEQHLHQVAAAVVTKRCFWCFMNDSHAILADFVSSIETRKNGRRRAVPFISSSGTKRQRSF